MRPTLHELAVRELEPLTDDAVAITFEVPPELRDQFEYAAGQHIAVTGPDGVRRSYSLADPPSANRWRVGVKRIPGGGFSDAVLPGLKPGDRLEVLTPAGRFGPAEGRRHLAIAAGSGITPILSIAGALLERPDTEVTLLCADRTARSAMFLDEVHALKDRYLDRLQLVHVLSREQLPLEVQSGRLDPARLEALSEGLIDLTDLDAAYLCGPFEMVTTLTDALADLGVPKDRIHAELFHAEPVRRTHVTDPALADGAHATLRLDGRSSSFTVPPDQSVLEAGLAVRADLPFACKGGVCGTCRSRLVEGTVEMDANWALAPDEVAAGMVLLCQSHPTSPEVAFDSDLGA